MRSQATALISASSSNPSEVRCPDSFDDVPNIRTNVLGIQVHALDMETTLSTIREMLLSGCQGYICAIGVHGIMEAQRDAALAATFAGAALLVPDGMPLVWVGHLDGQKQMRRVAGPDLMREMFRRPEFCECRHFLYGGEEGIADRLAEVLRSNFPWSNIVGTYTPPYRDLTEAEEEDLVALVNAHKPDIVWVGISTPRQEKFMRRILPRLDAKLMFGVGAAFDFHTGRIKDCSSWIKQAGLQWLHRLLQDPRRLWRRYLRNNPVFLWRIALQLAGLRSNGLEKTTRAELAPDWQDQ